jgi:hypothetical protein
MKRRTKGLKKREMDAYLNTIGGLSRHPKEHQSAGALRPVDWSPLPPVPTSPSPTFSPSLLHPTSPHPHLSSCLLLLLSLTSPRRPMTYGILLLYFPAELIADTLGSIAPEQGLLPRLGRFVLPHTFTRDRYPANRAFQPTSRLSPRLPTVSLSPLRASPLTRDPLLAR